MPYRPALHRGFVGAAQYRDGRINQAQAVTLIKGGQAVAVKRQITGTWHCQHPQQPVIAATFTVEQAKDLNIARGGGVCLQLLGQHRADCNAKPIFLRRARRLVDDGQDISSRERRGVEVDGVVIEQLMGLKLHGLFRFADRAGLPRSGQGGAHAQPTSHNSRQYAHFRCHLSNRPDHR
uniref:Uncharacterized protein n=1 Tax=Yoonia rhodophyticola TaxID=3137370 RepID=A0AAN0MGE9_9RHOB